METRMTMHWTRRQFLRCGALAAAAAFVPARHAAAAMVKACLPTTDLDFLGDSLNLVRRDEWAGEPARLWLLRAAAHYDRITLHHAGERAVFSTGRDRVQVQVEGIRVGHVNDRGYGDIGYHFVVDYAGRVWEGRSLAYEGAHVSDQNEANIGIVLLGNFNDQDPSAEQLAAMNTLVLGLREHYRIKPHRVYGHRDLGQSFCPGNNLYPYVARMRQAVPLPLDGTLVARA